MIRVSGDLLGVLKLFVYGSDGDDTSVGKTLLRLLLIHACTTMRTQGGNYTHTLVLEWRRVVLVG